MKLAAAPSPLEKPCLLDENPGARRLQEQQFRVYTIVHRGSLHDANHERRIGIWFVPCEAGSQLYFHVKGDFSRFLFEVKRDWDPTGTASAMDPVYLGRTRRLTEARLHSLMKRVPIENHDLEFNGQQWIWGALDYLTSDGYLSREQRDTGFNNMLDQVLEGSSDELPNRPGSH